MSLNLDELIRRYDILADEKYTTKVQRNADIEKSTDGSPMADYCLELALASVRSDQTRDQLKCHLKRFVKFSGFKTHDEILQTDRKELEKILIGYILHLSNSGLSPNTIPTYMFSIKCFLDINDLELSWKKIKKFIPRKRKTTGQSAYSTEQVKEMLGLVKSHRNKAVIHFLASTGCRAGAVPDITVGDLRDMPHGCQMVTVYEDDIEEYKTFLTPEAVAAIGLYLKERKNDGEIITEDSMLFLNRDGSNVTYSSIQMIVKRVSFNAKIKKHQKHGRFDVQICHGFRKRFNTILKLNNEVNDNAIEKMMGHKNGLDGTYLQITDERLFEEFYKGITDLSISDEFRDKVTIEKLRDEVPESYQEEMMGMKKQMAEMSRLISELKNPDRENLIQQEWESLKR